MKHQELCERAVRWLEGARHCDPVLGGIASAGEVPDAIGWSSAYKHRGSTLVECKTSKSDFYADKAKYLQVRHREHGWTYPLRRIGRAERKDYEVEPIPCMGDYRFFMSEPGIITPEMVTNTRPDHGLLWVTGRTVKNIIDAPRRDNACHPMEIRVLRFALIHIRANLCSHGFTVHMGNLSKGDGEGGLMPVSAENSQESQSQIFQD